MHGIIGPSKKGRRSIEGPGENRNTLASLVCTFTKKGNEVGGNFEELNIKV